jgi:hypothetical protein
VDEGARPAATAGVAVDVLYGLDLLLVLLWTQDRTAGARATHEAIALLAKLIDVAMPLMALPAATRALSTLRKVFQSPRPKKERS